MTNQIWTSKDAWVLQSLKLSCKENSGATITQILRAGDFVNHDIIDFDTLKQAIIKLRNADLIYLKNEQFFLTEKCLHFIEIQCTSKQIYKHRDQILNMLETVIPKHNLNIDINFLTKDFYETAYIQYINGIK